MNIFINIIGVTIGDTYQIVSIALVNEQGYSFYAEFMEFDPLIEKTRNDTLFISKMINDLKYKDMLFMDSTPFYTTEFNPVPTDKYTSKYSFSMKANSHQILFELNKWVKTMINNGDRFSRIIFFADPETITQWDKITNIFPMFTPYCTLLQVNKYFPGGMSYPVTRQPMVPTYVGYHVIDTVSIDDNGKPEMTFKKIGAVSVFGFETVEPQSTCINSLETAKFMASCHNLLASGSGI
jgi:hypothetical protein